MTSRVKEWEIYHSVMWLDFDPFFEWHNTRNSHSPSLAYGRYDVFETTKRYWKIKNRMRSDGLFEFTTLMYSMTKYKNEKLSRMKISLSFESFYHSYTGIVMVLLYHLHLASKSLCYMISWAVVLFGLVACNGKQWNPEYACYIV